MLRSLLTYLNLLVVILLCFLPLKAAKAKDKKDSLLQVLNEVDRSKRPEVYMELFINSVGIKDSALHYANLAREYSLIEGDSLNYVRAEYALGYIHKSNGDYHLAIQHYNKALKSARKNNLRDREMASLNGLALSYYSLAKFDLALRYHFESLNIREDENDQQGIAIATNNIGLVYYQLKDHNKALIYFERTKQIEEVLGLESIYGTYVNLGLTQSGLNNIDKAQDYFTLTLNNCKAECDPMILIEGYIGRSNCYLANSEFENALQDMLSALSIAKKHNIKVKQTSIYNGLSSIYLEKNQPGLAKVYLDSSQALALEFQTPREIKENFRSYADIAYANGDFKKAFEYQHLYDSVDKLILNELVAKNLLQIQVDFEERENLEIIELQNKEISRRTTLLILSIIISILTAFIVVILNRNNALRKRVNKKLQQANETIEDQNKILLSLNSDLEERVKERTEELRTANAALIKSNHELDNFIYKTSHDIRGPLATLQGICNIALMDIKDPMSVDYFQKLSKTALKLNNILSKLLIVNQINNSLPSQEEFNLNLLVEEIVENNKISYLKKEINISIKGEDRFAVESDYELLKIIISNIVNNAFKFHNPSRNVSSFVEIDFLKGDNALILTFTDNGMGIDSNISDQIFDIFSKTSEMQDSAGMGLYLVKLAVDKLEGNILVSKTDKGYTLFTINIPLK